MTAPLLSVRNASKAFRVGQHHVSAFEDVSLDIHAGETHAIVGESGSGKTTLGNVVLGILAPTEGELYFDGAPLPLRRPRALKRRIQLVQQNPLSSLNPKRTVLRSLVLPMAVHGLVSRDRQRARAEELMAEVGLEPGLLDRYPVALSGGQLQRVAIARALACEPDLIVLDEPTASLDVLVQARVLRLLHDLSCAHALTYMFITHDLGVVRNLADRVSVFDRGRIVEAGEVERVFNQPAHPYTARLLASVPVVSEAEDRLRAGALARLDSEAANALQGVAQ